MATTSKEVTKTSAAESRGATEADVIGNSVKLFGEYAVIPGASLLLDGNIKLGVVHAAAGIAGRMLLGPLGLPAWVLAAANSYAKSCTNKNLYQLVTTRGGSGGTS